MKYFTIKELVPPEVYNELGEKQCWDLFEPKALEALENVREILGVPLVCNNWAKGGNRKYCGFRQSSCPIGAKYSLHKLACAFDLISSQMTAKEMRDKLEKNQDKLIHNIRIEKWDNNGEISWLHIDTKDMGVKLYFFKA